MGSARDLMGAGVKVLASASAVVATAGTTAFDWGTPNDVYLPTVGSSTYKSGDRLLLILSAKLASGTTDSLAFTVQDADDTDGGTTIGTPATAITDASSVLTAAKGARAIAVGVHVQPNRPWLRVNYIHSGGGSDSYQTHATLLAIPTGL